MPAGSDARQNRHSRPLTVLKGGLPEGFPFLAQRAEQRLIRDTGFNVTLNRRQCQKPFGLSVQFPQCFVF